MFIDKPQIPHDKPPGVLDLFELGTISPYFDTFHNFMYNIIPEIFYFLYGKCLNCTLLAVRRIIGQNDHREKNQIGANSEVEELNYPLPLPSI